MSAFDETEGLVRTDLLTKRWPFRQTPDTRPFQPADSAAALVYAALQQRTPWSEIRYQLAELYARHGEFPLARRECYAVAKVIPFSFQPLLRLADYYAEEGRAEAARDAYRHSAAVEENPFAHMKLGLLFLQDDRYAEAAQEFETGFRVERTAGPALGTGGSAQGRYLLGISYANLGRLPEARENLQHALAIDPSLRDAAEALRSLH